MRQLSSLLGTANMGAGPTAVFSAIIPPNSWANGKCLLIRGWYLFTIGGGGLPPNYNVTEFIGSTQGATSALLTSAPFVPIAGIFGTWIERRLIRMDPVIRVFDMGDVMQKNYANRFDNQIHVIQHTATAPPFDYTQQMQVDLLFNLPPTLPSGAIQGRFCESFLEQATNLGKLP